MYRVIEGRTIVEGKEYDTYGIAYDDLLYINDISTDKNEVANLVELCNKGKLDVTHLNDVVDDFLAKM